VATQRIRATAEAILSQREDGQAVLRMRLLDGEAVRAVGTLTAIQLGEECKLVGRYVYHERSGRQFVVASWQTVLPTSTIGIERFLASGLFKGVGPQTAKRLVGHFGVRTLQVLMETPQELAVVPGLSTGRAAAVVSAFTRHQDLARLASFLRSHDLPLHLAAKLAGQYGSGAAALQALQTNPYQAAEDVRGIGFRTADHLARAVGIAETAPERLAAALLHALTESDEEGHLYLPLSEWLARAVALTGSAHEMIAAVAAQLSAGNRVVYRRFDADVAVYTPALDRVEQTISQRLLEFVQVPSQEAEADDRAGSAQHAGQVPVEVLAPPVGVDSAQVDRELRPEQWRAARSPFSHRLVIVTGGPGTGKTTTLRTMVELATAAGWRVALAAPTGRAAKRLSESTGQAAYTLHRLLEVGQQAGGRFGFGRNRNRRLEGDLWIVDEASMIDAPLFASFLDALPAQARLVLVGDPEQLPSVGPGEILRDVIASGVAAVHELQYVFRQGQGSLITAAAHAVRVGRMPQLERTDAADCYFIQEDDSARTAELVVQLATARLPRYLDVDPIWGIQVLTPMRKGICGVDRLNERLSALLADSAGHALSSAGRVFRSGDKVIYTKNDYDRDIYNGDMGTIVSVDGEQLEVRYDELDNNRTARYSKAECAALQHAYAITVHKSQGSEYPCVILPLVREHTVMLHRKLVYTAMTRARRLLVLVGSRRVLELAVARMATEQRYTGLIARVKAQLRQNG